MRDSSPPWPAQLGPPEALLRLPAEALTQPAENSASRVVRLTLPGCAGTVIAKIYQPRRFKPSRAWRAFARAGELEGLQIPVARPLAAADLAGGESLLVLEDVVNARTLREVLPAQPSLRLTLLRQLAQIMARLHSVNLAHTDPTLGNFLVQQQGGAARVVVIDVDAVRPANRATRRGAIRDLRLLLQRIPMSPREQLWLIAQYCRQRTPRFDAREFQQRLLKVCVRSSFWIGQRFGSLRWMVRRGTVPEVAPLCEDIEKAINSATQLLKNSPNVTVARVAGASGRGLIIRRMNYDRLRHRLKDFFRQSRARRAFFRGLLLEQADVATPRMLAVAEKRRFRWPVAAYMICEEVLGAQTLSAWVRDGCKASRKVVTRLADLIARLHNRGFVHRDLKGSNVLLDERLTPWLIDMDGVRFVREVSIPEAVRDLLVLGRALKGDPTRLRWLGLRYLKRYARQRRLSDSDVAVLWQHWPAN
jgi:tRNA A-37 threonylcarbamoyl transferase component Bud32